MHVDINLKGMEKLDKAIQRSESKLSELRKEISYISKALDEIHLEINQPTDGTDG